METYIVLGVGTDAPTVISVGIFPIKINIIKLIGAHEFGQLIDESLSIGGTADHIAKRILSWIRVSERSFINRNPSLKIRFLVLQGCKSTVERSPV